MPNLAKNIPVCRKLAFYPMHDYTWKQAVTLVLKNRIGFFQEKGC